MKWTTETGETRYLAVHALPAWGGGSQCDPADIICALKANPEACAEVMRALAPLTMANANADRARAEKAERERDEARAERDMPCAHLAEERRLESELDALKAKLAEAECHADPPPDYLTRAELVAAVRSAASAVGGPPRRALDALADALEIPRT